MKRRLQVLAGLYVLALGSAVTPLLGPVVESRTTPIFTVGRIIGIVRSDDYLCWTWVTDKLRPSAAEDIDAVLVRPAIGDVSWPEVIDAHTRHPWHRLGSRPPGADLRYDSCVRLPDDLKPEESVLLTQTLLYPSAWGSWRVPVQPPDVVSPGRPPP